jgi:hypothetical protein
MLIFYETLWHISNIDRCIVTYVINIYYNSRSLASMGAGRGDKPGISSIFWISGQTSTLKKEGNVLWRVYTLLGNGSVNAFQQKQTRGTIGRPLLDNGPVNTHSRQYKTVFSVGSVQSGYKCSAEQRSSRRSTTEYRTEVERTGSSSGDGGRRWLRRNDMKGIRMCQEDFTCDLKLQWDCDNRRRLVKTENVSACATVNWKVCKSVIALYCLSPELCECLRCNKSNHPIQTQSSYSPLREAILNINTST